MCDHVIINAVGDIWFGDHPVRIGHGVMSKAKIKSPEYLFAETKDLFKDGDFNFCNLEGVLSEKGIKRWLLSSIEMRGYPECINGLLSSHFNIANIANNHILQHGKKAYDETIVLLKKNNIAVIGTDDNKSSTVEFFEKNGMSFAFVGYSLHTEEYYQGENIAYSYRENSKKVLDEIENLRENFNGFIVCSLHWGQEFLHYPSVNQIKFARTLVDKGVNLILGHHPHVLQGIEEYNNGLICYSLGNFIFDLWPEDTKKTVLLKVKVSKGHKISYTATPLCINEEYQPTVAGGELKSNIENDLALYSRAILKSISEGKNTISQAEKKRIDNNFRNSQYIYFINNFFRYSIMMIFQSVMRTLYRRIF